MDVMDFLLAEQNVLFTGALGFLLIIAALELISLILGLGFSEFLDGLLPDFDTDVDLDADLALDGADLDADLDLDLDGGADPDVSVAHQTNVFMYAFGWLNVGRLPLLILMILFFGIFTLVGYAGQMIVAPVTGLLPAVIMGPIALVMTLPLTRQSSRLIARAIPREESYAVGDEQFVGLVGRVSLGPVDRESPGKAKVQDRHGESHFVRIRAADEGSVFELGSEVLLVAREGHLFDVIAPPGSLAPREQTPN